MLSIAMQARPEGLETAMLGPAPPGSEKGLGKALILKWLHQRAGLPEPAWLAALRFPIAYPTAAGAPRPTLRGLFARKFFGPEVARYVNPNLDVFDLSFLEETSFELLLRHNPNYVPYMPDEFRAGLLAAYARYGIQPFDERDWRELERINTFLVQPSLRDA